MVIISLASIITLAKTISYILEKIMRVFDTLNIRNDLFVIIKYQLNKAKLLLIESENLFKDNIKAIIIYSILYFAITLVFGILSFLFFHLVSELSGDNKSLFDKWDKASQVAVSAASFVTIILSVKIFQDTDRRQVNQATISAFEKFRDKNFADIRKKVWEVKKKWSKNENGYQIKLEANSFDKEATKHIVDNLLDDEKEALDQDILNIRDLLEFYVNLTIYEDKPEALKNCRYFYYDWWRSFLYEMAKLHDNNYLQDQSIASPKNLNYEDYKYNVSYINKLNRLDKMFGFDGVDINEIFY